MRSDKAKKWMDFKPGADESDGKKKKSTGLPQSYSGHPDLTIEDFVIIGLIESAKGGNAAAVKALFDIRYGPAASGSGSELSGTDDEFIYEVFFDGAVSIDDLKKGKHED